MKHNTIVAWNCLIKIENKNNHTKFIRRKNFRFSNKILVKYKCKLKEIMKPIYVFVSK